MNEDIKNQDANAIKEMKERILENLREYEKRPLSFAEKKTRERERIMFANFHYDRDWFDDSDSNCEPTCPICGAKCSHANKENLKLPWLGLGVEEHCWECGANPEHHDPLYQGRFEGWSMYHMLEELIRVEGIYCSNKFMTREQIAKNREYFCLIVSALQSAKDHRPNRYQDVINQRHSGELYERLIQLATHVHGGDRSKALEEYEFMSHEIGDLYTIIDELEAQLHPPTPEMEYKEQHKLQHPILRHTSLG